jgi:hypothetical protein
MFLKVKKHFTESKSTTASNEVTADISAAGGKATASGAYSTSSNSGSTVAATDNSGDDSLRADTAQQLQPEHVTLFSRYVLYNTHSAHMKCCLMPMLLY